MNAAAGSTDDILFDETQSAGQWWFWAAVLPLFFLAWYVFISQIILHINPFGTGSSLGDASIWIIWAVFGILVPFYFATARMRTRVTRRELRVRYWPILFRDFEARDIIRYQVRDYSPLRDYGGWGVRWSPKNGWAYNARGSRGVQLDLEIGKKLMIGSQRPEELAAALDVMTGGKRRKP